MDTTAVARTSLSGRAGPWTDADELIAQLRLLHERFHAASGQALQLRDDPVQAEPHVTELFRLSATLVDLMFRLDRLLVTVPSS